MKRLAKKLVALTVVICSLLSSIPSVPAAASTPATHVIANDYIEATVSTNNGGFIIRTAEGDILTKADNNKDLLYRRDAFDTSFTSFLVTKDGITKEYIFGNDYSFLGLGSNNLTVTRTDTGIRAVWSVDGITFTQLLEPVLAPDSHQHGTVKISYAVQNGSGKPIEVKARLLLDTALGNQDYAYYEVAQEDIYEEALRVEKELVLDTAAGDYIPATFFAYDNYLNPTIAAYTIRDESANAVLPYKIAFGHWNNLASTIYEFTPNLDLTFTNRYNKAYLTADSAFAMYYDLGAIAAGQLGKTVSTYYGVDSKVRVKDSDKVGLTISAPPVLSLSPNKMTYLGPDPNLPPGVFDITVNVTNLARPNAETLPHIAVALFLDDGLTPLDENGEEIWPMPTNDSPYYIELGNIAVGEVRQVTFKSLARVLANTTYRRIILRAYDMTTPDAELLLLENLLGSSLTYVLCPGNNASPPLMTFTASTPQAIHKEGNRTITITGTGLDKLDYKDYYNLRAYLKSDRSIFFEIYKNYISRPTDDTCQIILTEPMPVGEYEFVFHWTSYGGVGDTPQGDITAPALSFFVTDDVTLQSPSYNIIAISKHNPMPNTYYSTRAFSTESEFDIYKASNEVLLTFRGSFIVTGYNTFDYVTSCYAISSSRKDSISINDVIELEKGNLQISRWGSNEIRIEFEGDLYTTKSRNKVWQGSGALTPLTNKVDFGLLKYNERGERLFGQQPANPISIIWPGGYSMLQTIGGMAVDLRYGQFGAMYGGASNTDFKGHVISFGGKLDLSFLLPGGAKQSQELEREAHAENKSDSVDTKEEDGVVKQDVTGYSPTDKAKAENEKNKVKPAGKVNIEDVLFGLNKGFLGFNSQAEIMLPKYFAALPAMGGILRINTIGGYDVGVKGIAKTKKFNLEFDLRVKNAPGSDVPVPDKIYFFMGGFEPGINVDGAGAFWVTGLGGGVDKLYDTIFSGGLPPLTLLLSAEYDIVKAMSGRADLALSLYGFMINMSDIKLKNTPVVVIKNAQLAVEWMPDFYMHLAAYLELYEIISGKAYIVVDNDFYELFARTTVSIPKDIKVVGGMTVGGVDLGGNNNKLWGTISALGIKLGLTYYWGGSTVHFGSGGSTSSPTYPELLGLADVPVGTTEDGSETLYLRVGSNLYALETIIVESFDDTAPVLLSLSPTLSSNLSKTTHRLNLGDSEQDAAITVECIGEGRPLNISEAQAALEVRRPDSSKYELVYYDGSNPTTANANLIVNDELGITTVNFTITEYLAGDWTVTTTQAADIVLYMVGAIPEVTSFTASHDVADSKLNLTWAGSLLDECKISLYATPDIGVPGTDDAGELGSLIATIGGLGASEYPVADGQSLELSLPANLPSGSYYVRMLVSSEDTANQSIVATTDGNAFMFEHLNSLQPQIPGGITLENVGNNMFRLNIAEPPLTDYDGYLVDIFENTAEGLVPTVFADIPFGKDEDITIGGTFISTDGQPYGLVSGKEYIAKVSAYIIADNGTIDDSDDVLIQSVDAASNLATLRTPTPPTISYIPTSPHTLLSKTIQLDEHTNENITVPTFTTQEVSFTLESDTPVSGYWSLNGALSLDVLDPSSALHEVSNVSRVDINQHLYDGEHSVTFSGINAHGDSFVFTQVFAVDTSPPKLLLSSPVNGTFFAEDGHIPVTGQGDADSLYTIKVNGIEVLSAQPLPTESGVISYDLWVDPTVTSHKIAITATDIVGNSTSHTATVLNKGLITLNEVGLLANGSVFTNKNFILNQANNTTVQLELIGQGNNDSTFIIKNERAISWNTVAIEGNASIDQDGVLVISPGSVGFAQGSLQVLDSHLLTATMTFGAEVYATEQYHLVLASTMGGTMSGLEGQYSEGAEIPLSATPAPGYQFDGWVSSHGGNFANAAQAATTFTMPANNTVVTAQFTHIRSTPTPTPTYPNPQTLANRIGLYANGVLIAYIPIVDGELSASLAQSIRQHIHMGITNIDISLLPSANGNVVLNISPEAAQVLSSIEVTLHSSYGTLAIPAEALKSLAAQNPPLSIIIERVPLESLNDLSPAGTEPLSDVLRIETKLKGKVKVTMPLDLKLPSQAQERQALLQELMVFVLHSDNTRQMIYDLSFDIDAATQILKSISFWVESFSSFALVKPNYQALTTTVGSRGYSLNNVERDMVACYYKNTDTMMPIRMLEDFGVNFLWDEATKTATMTYKQTSVVLTIGSTTAKINGISAPIIGASGKPVAPELAPGRTMIPLRFVSEHLGFVVDWDPSNLVTIKLKE